MSVLQSVCSHGHKLQFGVSAGISNLQVEATFHFRTLGSGKGDILQS